MHPLLLFSLLYYASIATSSPARQDSDAGDGTPRHQDRTTLTIINGTPHQWKRGKIQSYQLRDWDTMFPDTINAKSNWTGYYDFTKNGDDAGDVTYSWVMDGKQTDRAFDIHVQAHDHYGFDGSTDNYGGLEFAGHLSSQADKYTFADYSAKGAGPAMYVIAGDDKVGYTGVSPPVGWMGALGSKFKKLALSQIVLPAAHDSAMSDIKDVNGFSAGLGDEANTRTQSYDVYGQLVRGARVLYWRPYLDARFEWQVGKGDFQMGHFTGALGGYGQSLNSAIDNLNTFRRETPGELIIIDLTEGFMVQGGDSSYPRAFTNDNHIDLFNTLYRITGADTVYTVSNSSKKGGNITMEPIETFYQHNSSPILIRVSKDHIPKNFNATINDDNTLGAIMSVDLLPFEGGYSDSDSEDTMRDDQLDKLKHRNDKTKTFQQSWTLTLSPGESILSNPSIETLSARAHEALYTSLWKACSMDSYPNELIVDYIRDSQIASLAMAMNVNFAIPNVK